MNVSFTKDDIVYQYNQATLQQALEAKGLDAAEVRDVLKKMSEGDLGLIDQYDLSKYVQRSYSPNLDSPRGGTTGLASALEKTNQFNFVAVMQALHEAARELTLANREMRHAERDSATADAMAAAEKIRSSALVNLCFGVVSGSVNIVMGAISVKAAATQALQTAKPAAELKAARVEMQSAQSDLNLSKAQVKLNETQVKLDQIQAKVDARIEAQTKLKVSESKVETLESELAEMQKLDDPQLQDAIAAKNGEIIAARKDVKNNQDALDDLRRTDGLENKGVLTSDDQAGAAPELVQAKREVAAAKGDVEKAALEAKKDNTELLESLKGQKEDKQRELESLRKSEGPNDPNGKIATVEREIGALDNQIVTCEAKAALYNTPTEEASLRGAGERAAELGAKLNGETGAIARRFSSAQSALNDVNTQAQISSAKLQGQNMTAQGITQGLSAAGAYWAAAHEADGAEHTAESQKHSSKESEDADYQKSFEELTRNVRDVLKDFYESYNQANSTIYQNM